MYEINDTVEDLKELIFLSKFFNNKKNIKKERDELKKVLKDLENGKTKKYITYEDNDYD